MLNYFASSTIIINISKISNVFIPEPYLFPKEKVLFYSYLDKAQVYFEYGSSGMIHQAAKRGCTIYSAEVGPAWVLYLKKEIEKIERYLQKKINITYLYSDLQSNINPSYEDFKKYVTLYDHKKYKADLIYINGKYHASCALNIYNQIDNKTIIIARDISKKAKNSIKSYYDQICKVQRTYVFRKKKTSPILDKESIEKVDKSNFNSHGRLHKILSFLRVNFNDTIMHYLNYNNEEMMIKPSKRRIWFMWWQGMKNAPPIVKLCLSAIKQNFPDGEINVITNETLSQTITLPSYIYEKLYNQTLSIVHLSDILRLTLLSRFGGLWVDATLFSTKKLPSEIFEIPYYTIHFDDTYNYVTGKWTGFCQGSYINNIVPKFSSDIFLEYTKRFEKVFDYFFQDYILLLGYELIPSFKRTIENVPFNNPGILDLDPNEIYTNEKVKDLTKNTFFFKSTWKKTLFPEIDGHQTLFGYFLSQYLGNITI